jgi:glycosyltransferase involved in cell wall biosynthesis
VQIDLLIDARALRQTNDGAGNYLLEVLPRMMARASGLRYALIVDPSRAAYWKDLLPTAHQVLATDNPIGLANQLHLPLLVAPLRPRVYFCPNNTPPLLVPGRLVFTVHDLTPLTHRPYFENYSAVKTAAFHAMVWSALRRASRVIAVSDYTKSCIAQQFGERFAGITDVILHGSQPADTVDRRTKGAHFLYVGTDRPHKNLARLLDAYELAVEREPNLPPLVLVGQQRRAQVWRDRVASSVLSGRVKILGYVGDAELENLYLSARALVFPSLSEGFGLPILEAMRRGVPVLTGSTSATREVAGDAALLVDASSTTAITEGLLELWRKPELCATLSDLGTRRCALFDWESAAEKTWCTIDKQLRLA